MTEALLLRPVFQEKIWGGQKLKTVFGYPIPDKKIGECWAISAHPHGTCVVENGPYAGRKLDELWENERALFGNPTGSVFPLLTKILDAEDDLSVQVHPDDRYGLEHEGELGKTECWYVIDCEPGAEIIYGHHAQTKEELRSMIESGQWEHLLRRIPVKPGDFYYVPSGTIHAIGKGILILETQQSSDTTYRVYDYDRRDDQGNLRELHIDDSVAVTNVPHHDPTVTPTVEVEGENTVTTYVKTAFFTVHKWEVGDQLTLKQVAPYTLGSVLAGTGELVIDGKATAIAKGDHFILPATVKSWTLKGKLTLIASEPGTE